MSILESLPEPNNPTGTLARIKFNVQEENVKLYKIYQAALAKAKTQAEQLKIITESTKLLNKITEADIIYSKMYIDEVRELNRQQRDEIVDLKRHIKELEREIKELEMPVEEEGEVVIEVEEEATEELIPIPEEYV